MGNCLVTKLKGVVNNENLPVYGMMDVIVNSSNCAVRTTPGTKVYLKGGTLDGQTEFTTSNQGWLVTNKTVVSDGTYGEGNLLLMAPKYDLYIIAAFSVDAADLIYTKISFIDLSDGYIKNASRLSEVFGLDTLSNISLYSVTLDENVDLTELGSNGILTEVSLGGRSAKWTGSLNKLGLSPIASVTFPANKNVDFSVETFVANNRTAGRTTGSLNLKWVGACNSTFNGEAIAKQENNPLSWTATTITFDGTTIDA